MDAHPQAKTIGPREVKIALALVDLWNKFVKPPIAVTYTDDAGRQISTQVRSEAWVLESGHPVIKIVGKSGCVALERVAVDVQTTLRNLSADQN